MKRKYYYRSKNERLPVIIHSFSPNPFKSEILNQKYATFESELLKYKHLKLGDLEYKKLHLANSLFGKGLIPMTLFGVLTEKEIELIGPQILCGFIYDQDLDIPAFIRRSPDKKSRLINLNVIGTQDIKQVAPNIAKES